MSRWSAEERKKKGKKNNTAAAVIERKKLCCRCEWNDETLLDRNREVDDLGGLEKSCCSRGGTTMFWLDWTEKRVYLFFFFFGIESEGSFWA